jgi:hypothetical protein
MADRNDEIVRTDADIEITTDQETAQIRAEIRETRARVGETLEQLGERLNPRVLKEQVTTEVKQGIRDATIGKVENMTRKAGKRLQEGNVTLMERIKDNPVPAAMIAIGLGWLIMSKRSTKTDAYSVTSSYDYSSDDYTAFDGSDVVGDRDLATSSTEPTLYSATSYDYRTEDYDDMGHGASVRGQGAGLRDKASQAAERARSVAGSAADRAKAAAGTAQERARSLAGSASTKARSAAQSVKQGASSGAQRVSQVSRDTSRKAQEQYQESPLAMGAVAMALGVAAGLAIPVSDREVRLMGDARDQVVDRARDLARETVDKVENVAGRVWDETRDSAKTAAREEGLVS